MDTDYPLPPNYTIFGKVTKGQEVVNTIARVERGSNDRPIAPVTFTPEVRN
jgi:cyclophilin family peptidyl-prolyl cis-trans isomerase